MRPVVRRWLPALLAVLLVFLFFVGNRGSYRGWFMDDDLDTLSWTPNVQLKDYGRGFVSPYFFKDNFRPAGHVFYHLLEGNAGLDYRRWLTALNALHLLNVALVALLARSLKLPGVGVAAAAFFFAYHFAVFDAYWKTMYVFDVLCGTYSLLCLVTYVRGWWPASLLFFWAAYKSKELAVMLPVVLAAYEWWIGQRRWARLIPFFLISASFGLQALAYNRSTNTAYTLRLTPAVLAETIWFYGRKLVVAPLLLAPLFLRDRRMAWAVVAAVSPMLPLLVLPDRRYSVYLYVPLIGVALLVGMLASRVRPAFVAAAFALWLPWQYFAKMRPYRNVTLLAGSDNRTYALPLLSFVRSHPATFRYYLEGRPSMMAPWGPRGMIYYGTPREDLVIEPPPPRQTGPLLDGPETALVVWDYQKRSVRILQRAGAGAEPTHIGAAEDQADLHNELWFGLEGASRWTRAVGKVKLRRPANASSFVIRHSVIPGHLERGALTVHLQLNGQALPPVRLTSEGEQTTRWALPAGPPGLVEVELRSEPVLKPRQESRELGLYVSGLGFAP